MSIEGSRGVKTVRAAARVFIGRSTPQYLTASVVVLMVGRVLLGGFGWRDAVVAVVLVAIQPFVEWIIHVRVLHAIPRMRRGRLFDPGASHRAHHEDPWNLDVQFFDLSRIVAGQIFFGVLFLVLFQRWSVVLTGVLVATVLSFYYEWIHFFTHTAYWPKTRYYRDVWRAHRLHHFRNENYWHGITNTIADRLLGTFPKKQEVPLSPTARLLDGGDQET
jgi:hypothetical protein